MKQKKTWADYLWIAELLYMALSLCNILFAWLGLIFFFTPLLIAMLYGTYKVFTGAPLRQTVTLLWTFKLPWQWADVSFVSPWIAQFALGFFGVMLTSTTLGLLTMVLFRPRS